MADENKIRISDQSTFPDWATADWYCYRYNGSTYDNRTPYMVQTSGTAQDMWAASTNVMYWGRVSGSFTGIGFGMDTAAAVSGLQWQYSTGASSWTNFTPFHDHTNDFTNSGFISWSDPPAGTAWASHTGGGTLPAAYWVRATISGHTTTGKALNFLRRITLQPPLKLLPLLAEDLVDDTAGKVQAVDYANTGPRQLKIQCSQRATADGLASNNMPAMHLLHYWARHRLSDGSRHKLFIEDLAQTATPDLTADAPYTDYTGYLLGIKEPVYSPYKMVAGRGYDLVFNLEGATPLVL